MTKGRKTLPPAEQKGPEFVGQTPAAMAAAESKMNQVILASQENAEALAVQLGYDGSLTVGALEDEIRFYQRRSVEACLELGKRLLILKELTPHGEFKERVELLGIDDRMARRFMAATAKFANRASTPVLKAVGTQTKLLELLVLDDGEIEALEAGESARGITLDEIETMTVSELRAALREAKDDAEAKDRILEEKNKKIDSLAKDKKKRVAADPWPEEVANLNEEVASIGTVADEVLSKHLTFVDAVEALIDNAEPDSEKFRAAKSAVHHVGAAIERLGHLVAALQDQYETRLAGYIADDKSHVLDANG